MSALETLRTVSPGQMLTSDDVFEAIFQAGGLLSESRESDIGLEIAIRLLDAREGKQVPENCREAVDFLAEECGLYPYIDDPKRFNHLTQTLLEAHSIDLGKKIFLHSKQMEILLRLLAGDHVILSAPTSFGKTILVDAFIEARHPHTVVMIMPTIALIDECRRRLLSTFGNVYQIVTTSTEEYDKSKPVIFVLTQERFLQCQDVEDIQLLFVDEFYKLDPDRADSRYETLNLALYRALPKSKQVFMAGPHILNIELGKNWSGHFHFVKTDYKTVTVNVIDRSAKEDRFETFLADLKGVGEENSLVFTASPNTAETLMVQLINAGVSYSTNLGQPLGEWMANNYHPDWRIAQGTALGIAIHHGRLPRALGQLFVRLFDRGEIRVLICTSTLIEGVNTSAANVFIYDKKINRTDFDFFSFSNIKGRVGRMMRHFIGNAFLYHEPPSAVETVVEVPVLSDPGSSTDYLVMNVNREQLSQSGKERQDRLPEETGLTEQILKEHGAIGTENLVELFRRINNVIDEKPHRFSWRGFPDYKQKTSIAEFVLYLSRRKQAQVGIHTAAQLAWGWSRLQSMNSLPEFISWFAGMFVDETQTTNVDGAFQFLQGCEFTFPRSLAAVEALIKHARPDMDLDYSVYIVEMENWFRPHWMKQLDEAGIPVPLGERLKEFISPSATKAEALTVIGRLHLETMKGLDGIDRTILRMARGEDS